MLKPELWWLQKKQFILTLPLSKASKYLLWLSLAYSSCPGLPISILFAVCSAQVPMCHPEYLFSKTPRFYANYNTPVSLDLMILRVCQSIVVTCILHGLSSVDHSASLEVKRTVGQWFHPSSHYTVLQYQIEIISFSLEHKTTPFFLCSLNSTAFATRSRIAK